jgi:trans-aconitate 2-methyltransferase
LDHGAPAPRDWDARAYHALSEPQFEWGKRVLSTLDLRGDERIMDAGCGTGRLTALLAERLPYGRIVAVDRSENMVRLAAGTLAPYSPRVAMTLADICHLPFDGGFDVVFSTATFHWVLDHQRLFAEIASVLEPGGRLHAQCGGGANLDRIHRRAHALMRSDSFSRWFESWREPWEFADVHTTESRLRHAGFDRIKVDLERAPVVFADATAFAAFVSTVVLRPFLARIADEHRRRAFVDQITAMAADDVPQFELNYWRLNIRARKP